jgi:hypothetical protein
MGRRRNFGVSISRAMLRALRPGMAITTALGVLLASCAAPEYGSGGSSPRSHSRSAVSDQIRKHRQSGALRFAVIGDFGWGGGAQRAVARRMCRFRRRHPFSLVVTTGDNVYPDGAKSRFGPAFFRPYSCLLNNGVRFHASLGNHDYITRRGRPELRAPAFGMPRRNYVWPRKGVRFVIANSNRLRARWLRRALKPREGDRWTIAVFHHPVFSPGLHGSTPGFRPLLPRMFRSRGVDLVLNGHDHIYSVSKSLKGIRYVVTGGGGAPLYPCSQPWFTRKCREIHHFLYVTAYQSRIWLKGVPIKGRPFGLFSTGGRSPATTPRRG